MNIIFKEAKFGDKFLTRDGRIAIFIAHNEYNEHTAFFITSDWNQHFIDRGPSLLTYDGHFNERHDGDIISKYED